MEASYATELQWVGQDKRDTVACEVVHWVEVVNDRDQCGKEGRVHVNGSYIFHKNSDIKQESVTNYHVNKRS